jgi:hypothetical protein
MRSTWLATAHAGRSLNHVAGDGVCRQDHIVRSLRRNGSLPVNVCKTELAPRLAKIPPGDMSSFFLCYTSHVRPSCSELTATIEKGHLRNPNRSL